MAIITRGFLSNTIITRGFGFLGIVVRDIARITSRVIREITLLSPIQFTATVVSKAIKNASVISEIIKSASLISQRKDAEIVSILDLEDDPPPIPPIPPIPPPLGIYVDNNATGLGTGSFLNPYGPFSEIVWSEIDDALVAGKAVEINLKRGEVWGNQLVINSTGLSDLLNITIQPYGDISDGKPEIYRSPETSSVYALDKEFIVLDGVFVREPDLGGIWFEGLSKNNTFRNNVVHQADNQHGLVLIGLSGTPTTGNKIYNNLLQYSGVPTSISKIGAFFSYCNDSHIYQNECFWNEAQGIYLTNCENNIVEENYLNNNGGAGVYCNPSGKNIIRKNYYLNNGARVLNQGNIGLQNGSNENIIYMNVMESNADYGVLIANSSINNLFYNNTIVDTGKDCFRVYNTSIGNIFKNNLTWNNSNDRLTYMSSIPNVFDHNIYWNTYRPSGDNYYVAGGPNLDWDEWQPGYDPNGAQADPLLTYYDSGDHTLSQLWVKTGSPAIGLAEVLLGYEERLDPVSKWIKFDEVTGEILQASDVRTITDPTTTGAYAYV